jgi:hypothetical protein
LFNCWPRQAKLGLTDVTDCAGPLGLNISFCTYTVNASAFTVIAYNSRGQSATQRLSIPVGAGSFTVTDATVGCSFICHMSLCSRACGWVQGASVPAQLLPVTDRDKQLSQLYLQFPERLIPAKV